MTSRREMEKVPAAAGPARGRTRRPRALAVNEIHERVLAAIHEHRLLPGTQLVEEKLASIFGVSRTKIRQAIARLAHDGIVTVYRNRGAFVSARRVEEAREVFEARRVIEPWLIRRLAAAATAAHVGRLRAHVGLESEARAANDRRSIIRLSGEFHQLIAEMVGNSLVARTMRELESLTCLVDHPLRLAQRPGLPVPRAQRSHRRHRAARRRRGGAADGRAPESRRNRARPAPSGRGEVDLEAAFA